MSVGITLQPLIFESLKGAVQRFSDFDRINERAHPCHLLNREEKTFLACALFFMENNETGFVVPLNSRTTFQVPVSWVFGAHF